MAGLIKASLALHHRVLPPTALADEATPFLDRLDTRFSVNPKARPWVQGDPATRRRAAVNGFGRSGMDAHAVLEEHPHGDSDRSAGALLTWDTEAILLSAPDRVGLANRVRSLMGWLEAAPSVSLKDLAYTLNTARVDGPCRLGMVVKSPDELAERLRSALAKLSEPSCKSIRDGRGTYFWDRDPESTPKLGFLFPGEGSQYPGMLGDLCPHFPEVRALFDTSDRIARESGAGRLPSEQVFAPTDDQPSDLWSADIAVNVVLSSQWALYQLLSKLGLRPDAILGHSSGELLALAAAGVLAVDRAFEDKLGELGAIFGRLEDSGELPTARLVAVAAPRERVEAVIGSGCDVEVAMDNCPHQVVIAGAPDSVDGLVGRLKAAGMICEVLPFARAYHTPSFAPAMRPIDRFFESLEMGRPQVPVYSCASERRMPDDPSMIRRLAVEQWTRTVGFRRAVEAMHADGVDVFIDIGARGNLAGFVEDILRGRPTFAVAANLPRRSGTAQLNHLVASLFARGVDLDANHLYARRRPTRVDLKSPHTAATGAPGLQAACSTVKLSEGLIERLRSWTPPVRRKSTSPLATDLAGDLAEGSRTHVSLRVGSNGREDCSITPVSAWTDVDPALRAFQETMAAFHQTQQMVLEAFLADGPRNEPDFRFHVTDGLDVSTVVDTERPWGGVLVSLVEGRDAVSMLTLDVDGDPVAEHHTLGGRRISGVRPDWRGLPVLPFAVMAEIIAESASRLVPGMPLRSLRDVRAHRWIRYEDEPIALEIRASLDPDGQDSVRVAIHNRGPLRAMRPLEAPVFEGVACFGDPGEKSPIAPPFHLDHVRSCRFTPGSIYGEQWLFHGPALQAVVGIGPIAAGGIEGTLRVLPFTPLIREGSDPAALLLDPIILDNFTHLLGGWGLDHLADEGDVIFPLGLGELSIFGDQPANGTDVSCRISIRDVERHRILVDADIVRPDGSTWMSLRDWEDWRFHWPGRYRDGFRQPDRTFLGEPLDLPGLDHRAQAVWLEPPADMGRPVWRDVLEYVQLGPDERARYLALPGPDFRRTHRLWGRIAAKEAARRLRRRLGHAPEYPADLIVDHDSHGQPRLVHRVGAESGTLPRISIAHVEGVAVALACLEGSVHVGIDVEPIVHRSSTFEEIAFLPGEQAILGDRTGDERAEWVARLWCAKEAVAKATGLGFVDGPSGVEVVTARPGGLLGVRLRGGLAECSPGLAGMVIRVVAPRRGDFVWAWTLGEGMES